MKLSITTFQILCYLWNYPEDVLQDKDYLQKTIEAIDSGDINFTQVEKETAKEEINKLIETL